MFAKPVPTMTRQPHPLAFSSLEEIMFTTEEALKDALKLAQGVAENENPKSNTQAHVAMMLGVSRILLLNLGWLEAIDKSVNTSKPDARVKINPVQHPEIVRASNPANPIHSHSRPAQRSTFLASWWIMRHLPKLASTICAG